MISLSDKRKIISKRCVMKSIHMQPAGLRRLAKFLKLRTHSMKTHQIAELVWWRLSKFENDNNIR